MDVGEDSSSGDGGTDERVELLVSANGELEMTRGDALDTEILGGVTCSSIVSLPPVSKGFERTNRRAREPRR